MYIERERGIITSWGSHWYMYPSTALVTSRSSGPRHLHLLHNAGGHVWLHRCNPRGRHGDRGWVELVPLWSRVKRHSPNRWSLVIFFWVWHISHLINDWFEKWKDAIADSFFYIILKRCNMYVGFHGRPDKLSMNIVAKPVHCSFWSEDNVSGS